MALKSIELKKYPYFEFKPDMLNGEGHIRSLVAPDSEIIHYRMPGTHNKMTFDLWCRDEDGRADGLNNWE